MGRLSDMWEDVKTVVAIGIWLLVGLVVIAGLAMLIGKSVVWVVGVVG